MGKLLNYRLIPLCSCIILCLCGAIASIKMYRDHDYVIRFLKELTEKFSHLMLQIMMMNLLLDIDKELSLVIQQEKRWIVRHLVQFLL